MKSYRWLAIVAVLAAMSMGIWFQPGLWYSVITKPEWVPPNSLFGPVWTVLYIFIAIAGWRLWDHGNLRILWLVQIALNALWTPLFFGLHRPGWAFACIAMLVVTTLILIVKAWPKDKLSASLLIPYLAWISFASALNFTIWNLNGGPFPLN